ncbi:Fic family protein [Mesorhizobium sp. CO1-1-7]|nr:Fic family protein [Mesorhizobium sp. CO1-1-7]
MGHWHVGYVHPYLDGNGRMARFLMNKRQHECEAVCGVSGRAG